ncbi:phosphatidylinositol-4-phosphate 5-Kinase domain-containing protein [Hirsutella rhossiliensis]|uniref:Phosphatidylinositol-4-phosphate 5-Kinase domain-containing protein n=1 Tax=Hirsutella rhossiliensis TaxID=111463 RepID=A0A9P8SH60_9HYPO|nr:phosphatidylinositol-4-phosphate 5-Kinase domain-containing protein [Hirsutella rhossiliensis]KAH0962763.1 phosphatidylinositol-4-phosphate 5-Kinase domain-containing protein [Hirsutella rhossiliensis]
MAQQTAVGVPDRVVPMRVIVCGVHRTGTMSMRSALWQLGFHDCYHMHTVLQNLDSHPEQWIRAYEAKYAGKGSFGKADWDHLLGHCQACCDMPSAVFSAELAELYPDAKVVILNRDPELWERAARLYCYALDGQIRSWVRFTNVMVKLGMPFDHVEEKDKAIAWFKGQYQEFRDRIPAERCLEFRVQDGWKPLCEHLGVPVPMVEDEATGKPVEAPFPRINDRETFAVNSRRNLQQSTKRAHKNLVTMLGELVMMGMLGYGGWLAWARLGFAQPRLMRNVPIHQRPVEAKSDDPPSHAHGPEAAPFVMTSRTSRISASVADAVTAPDQHVETKGVLDGAVKAFVSFFCLFRLSMTRYRSSDFLQLRRDIWELDDDEYRDSFRLSSSPDASTQRVPAGDLGYSGSTFFTTPNDMYLVKSLPRRFEHQFFAHDLFDVYTAHMRRCPDSLLVRIVDMVYTPRATLGGLLGTAPTHHVVMENLLYRGLPDGQDGDGRWQYASVETYDLKPNDYFFPERDIAEGRLAPDSVKDRLVDTFPGKVRVSAEARAELLSLLDADTALLAAASAVDYSLFLVRFARMDPGSSVVSPFADNVGGSWRRGFHSTDGRWTYRAVVLDFFWAKKKLRAKAMTGLINVFNLLANKGPMSITAHPAEYRTRFMGMVDKLVVATGDDDTEDGDEAEADEAGL